MSWLNDFGNSFIEGSKDFFDWLSGEKERMAQQAANEREYKNAWEMYERQRRDALSDRAFENEYNSPANIMMRYKMAGLNPNLIYGNSYTAGASTKQASASGAPKTRTEYADPKIRELMDPLMSTIGTANQLATSKTIRASNIAQTSLAAANTAKSLAEAARTTQQKDQSAQLFDQTMLNAKLSNEKIKAETEAIPTRLEMQSRALDQKDEQIMQNARKLDQKDLEIEISKEKNRIYSAKTQSDIRKANEEILKSMVYRQTNEDVRKLMAAQISSAESKARIDEITASYTPRILDAQVSRNEAEIQRLYINMTNEILKSIPVLGWLVH